MTPAQVTATLRSLGFPSGSAEAIRTFQYGWALGPALQIDGQVGPATTAALQRSHDRLRAGQPTASAHFSFTEWTCPCGGRLRGCRRVLVARALLLGLESLRSHYYPGGVTIVSGYRCATHNRHVGGSSDSQHMYGTAADVPYAATTRQVRRLGVFSGIGQQVRTTMVRHVDVRHASPNNTTRSLASAPMVWDYST